MEREPESIGEEAVQSSKEGGVASVEAGSVRDVGAGSCSDWTMSVKLVDSDEGTMSVTGRMVGAGVLVMSVPKTVGEGESPEAK